MLPIQAPVKTSATTVDPGVLRFFAGSSHPELAADIAAYLGVPLDPTHIGRYSNDCMHIQLGASVRGRNVFIVQSLAPPVDRHLMELFMMLDIARGAAAHQVHAIIPYFSYSRSDKKDAPRISITARLVADLLTTAGATHVMTMTLHSPQVHGFFSIPTDPLTARPLFVKHFAKQQLDPARSIVVAPDIGHAKSASKFASLLGLGMAAGDKTRLSDTEVIVSGFVGQQVRGFRHAIIYDDEVATGGSVVQVARMLVQAGVEQISVACTHGLFVRGAPSRLAAVPEITEVVTTNTVPVSLDIGLANLQVLSVAPIFGEAIRRNILRQSIGDLFAFGEDEPASQTAANDE